MLRVYTFLFEDNIFIKLQNIRCYAYFFVNDIKYKRENLRANLTQRLVHTKIHRVRSDYSSGFSYKSFTTTNQNRKVEQTKLE